MWNLFGLPKNTLNGTKKGLTADCENATIANRSPESRAIRKSSGVNWQSNGNK
jgi:hypothetical protein